MESETLEDVVVLGLVCGDLGQLLGAMAERVRALGGFQSDWAMQNGRWLVTIFGRASGRLFVDDGLGHDCEFE